jgi:hypothetical protein
MRSWTKTTTRERAARPRPACPPPRVRASRVVLGSRHGHAVAGARPAPPCTRVARGGGGEYAGGRFRISALMRKVLTRGTCGSSRRTHAACTPLSRSSRHVRTRPASGRAAHRLYISEAYVNSPPPPRAHSRSRPPHAECMQCSARSAPPPRASGRHGSCSPSIACISRARPAPPSPRCGALCHAWQSVCRAWQSPPADPVAGFFDPVTGSVSDARVAAPRRTSAAVGGAAVLSAELHVQAGSPERRPASSAHASTPRISALEPM